MIKRFCDRCGSELELNYRKLSITTGTDNFLSIKGRMIGGTIHKEICLNCAGEIVDIINDKWECNK